MDKADSYIDRVKNLPSAPTVATQLLDMFKDPDREVDQIVELISHDPSLTTEVLKTCNGAYYGATEPVADMFEAVTRIGFYEVYTMVVGLVGAAAMNVGRSCSAFDTSALWKHSVTSAVAAETVAHDVGLTPATAFTAGLLHDLGKLLLATIEPARYLELTRKANGDGHALARRKQRFLASPTPPSEDDCWNDGDSRRNFPNRFSITTRWKFPRTWTPLCLPSSRSPMPSRERWKPRPRPGSAWIRSRWRP